MESVTEQSTSYVTVNFLDKTGALAVPVSATYRVDDVATDTEVRTWAALTAASSIEITLTKADNTILNTAGRNEERRVTVIAVYSATDQVTDEYKYVITNLKKIP